MHTLSKRMYHLDALFLIQVYLGSKLCHFLSEISGLEFLLGISENCTRSMYAVLVKVVLLIDGLQMLIFCRDADVFWIKTDSLIIFYFLIINY
jgi:hypothetical protein